MNVRYSLVIAMMFGVLASYSFAQGIDLTPTDEQVVKQAVAKDLLYPDRAEFSLLRASKQVSGSSRVVCGFVKAIEVNGFRGPWRIFNGMIATNKFNERVFNLTVLGISPRDQQIAEMMCAQDGIDWAQSAMQSAEEAANDIVAPPEDVAVLIEAADDLRRRCSGFEGADPASHVCERSAELLQAVDRAGWCRGRNSEAAYQAAWHPCGPDSVRAE